MCRHRVHDGVNHHPGVIDHLDHVKALDHVEHPEEIIQPSDYNLRYKKKLVLLHSVYLRSMPAVQFGIFSKKEVNLRKVVYLVLVVFWLRR